MKCYKKDHTVRYAGIIIESAPKEKHVYATKYDIIPIIPLIIPKRDGLESATITLNVLGGILVGSDGWLASKRILSTKEELEKQIKP